MATENTTSAATLPRNLGLWFHPHLNWKEKIASKFIDYLMCSNAMASCKVGSQESEKILATVRQRIAQGSKAPRAIFQKWASLARCPLLAVAEGTVPFRANILSEWGISNAKIPDISYRKSVGVRVLFPSKLLESVDSLEIDETHGCALVDFETIDWKTFAPQVPVIVQFHGGGMVVGQANDMLLLEETIRVVETANNMDLPSDVIAISVEYALSPEHPFPTAVLDALSVLDVLSDRQALHIHGISAGANLALVAGMEGFRKFGGGTIKSIQAHSPFVDPAADAPSYYTNQNVYPSIQWLRWCWQVYLQLDAPSNDENNDNVLRKGSNHTTWKEWKEANPSLVRLVNPVLELPQAGLDTENAPLILNRYNLGDPLHSDGKMVAQALKKTCSSTKAHSFESLGLHCDVLSNYDPNAPKENWTLWANALFGGK